jgi:hypothetical protein
MASKSYRQVLRPDEVELSARLDRRIAEMRRLLAGMEPGSAATALRVLRDAFPEASLEERVRALTAVRH